MRPLAATAMACATLVLTACAQPPAATTAPPPPAAITTATAALVEHASVERLPGTVRADRTAILQARVPGVVGRIAATPGTAVAAGTVLVELDAQELAAKRDQARALAAQAAADFERAKRLFETQAVTKAEFDAAQARATGSTAAAAEADIIVGYTRIAAPFPAVVIRRLAEVGDLVAPGRPIVELEDPASLRLAVEIPESLAAHVAVGARLRAEVAAAGFDAEAAVVEVTPAADPVSRSVLVKLALPPDHPALRSGQFGRVSVASAGGRLLAVPAAAIVSRGQLDAVFVVADGVARLRLVRLGGASGGDVIIRAGLAAGETVALDGAQGLADGQRVTLR